MPRKIKVKVSDLIKILEKKVQKIDKLSADFRCLIDVLEGLEQPDHALFSIPAERADDETDPCCGMCHQTRRSASLSKAKKAL